MFSKEIAEKIETIAREEISRYGLPTIRHFDLSLEKGLELAEKLNADKNLVRAGISLMDIKLGQAAKEGHQPEHVQYCLEFTKELLERFSVTEPYYSILTNCVAAHHGAIPFTSLESEIVANADCYRFIHPRGVMSFHATVIKRGNDHNSALEAVEKKLDEKYSILSLEIAKSELLEYYDMFKKILSIGKD